MQTTTKPGGKGKVKIKGKDWLAKQPAKRKSENDKTKKRIAKAGARRVFKNAVKIAKAGFDRRGRKGTVFANPKTPGERIGAAVKSARLANNLRAPEAAKLAKITVGYWHKIERAAVPSIPVHTITAVLKALGQSQDGPVMKAWLAAAAVPPAEKKAKAAKPAKTKKGTGKKKPSPKKKAA